mmetsp:Transcript_21190/g.30644  ORF Transcript_21190/g.30644 Transcript_21190/m.30644 type:complete len:195 (+) Transcript_21190:46-630(+)|eukprot:CAMPEP_0185017410 /NCGR_PEP_ID=MMETSP1103-20130426/368_1 /TAXON_ID=36769 /ORGANISM="Paraphysomonas bandaiensis, Strain Caron Lab Isolate" /LENGTH=194 /DNA_ID=CAMNT_0027546819 /DNA_START=46 /DNA_END=630 /DNA_ORIENTATION=+
MAGGKKVLKLRAARAKFAFKYTGAGPAPGVVGKYYPAEDVVPKKGPTPVRNPPKTRASITPGTVVILLAGRFRGKRVVVLKVLSSGLLLVTGPYSLNGVPLRRANQRYVIATSTKVPVDGVDVSKIDDDFFAREERPEGEVEGRGTVTSDARKAAQKAVDDKLLANVNKIDMLPAYLQAKFSLSTNDKPHAMRF